MAQNEQEFDPIMGVMKVVETWKEIVNSDSYIPLLAMYKARYFKELVKQGFTEEQALELISKSQIGT